MSRAPDRSNRTAWLRAAGVAVALTILARALAQADPARAFALLAHAGPALLVVPAPYLLAIAVDASAWRGLLAALGPAPRLVDVASVRLRTDALAGTLPGGALLAEGLVPSWLHAAGIPLPRAVAAQAARKCLVGVAQAAYLLASFALGFGVLRAASARLGVGGALPWIVLAAAIALLVGFGAASATLAGGGAARAIHAAVARACVGPLRRFRPRGDGAFAATDACLRSLGALSAAALARSVALFALAWGIEAAETLVIARAVGADVGYVEALAFEASLSLVRSLVFFVPAGLGAQDVGYLSMFAALGVPDAATAGAAFVVLKRAKELAWCGVGWALVVTPARRAREAAG